jgi:hypothetical protein
MKMLSQTLSFSEKLRALKSFFINTDILIILKSYWLARIMALFLAADYLQPSSARKKPEFLAAIKIGSPMARKTADFLAWSRL